MFIFICNNLKFVYKYINKYKTNYEKIPNFDKFR